MSVVGDNIKKRRLELGYSAETLAEMVGISPATMYRYENGQIKKVNAIKLNPIAKALQTTPAELMGWTDQKNNEDPDLPVLKRYTEKQSISEKLIDVIDRHLADYGITQNDAPKTPEARILARGMDKLPKEQREQALNVMRAMFVQYADYFEEGEKNDDDTEL